MRFSCRRVGADEADTMSSMINAQQHQVTGDGSTDDSAALQRLLNQPSPQVYLPPGVYKIGSTLRVGSNTRLDVHPQARLVFADAAGQTDQDFLLTNQDDEHGNTNIEITGGIWDGNNAGNPRVEPLIQPGAYSGRMIHFNNVRNLRFAHAMLANAESYFFAMTQVDGFLIEHIRFHTTRPRHNNDGIHPAGFCSNGVIRHLRGLGPQSPNDDMVALNADDAPNRVEVSGLLCGPIRNLQIYDLQADQCHTFVRMLSTVSPIENIMIEDVRGGCDVSLVNMDGARGCRVQVFDATDPAFAQGVGAVRNVRVSRARVFKTRDDGSPLLKLEQRMDQIFVQDIQRDLKRDAGPGTPTMRMRFLKDHHVVVEGLTPVQSQAMSESSTATLSIRQRVESEPSLGDVLEAQTDLDSMLMLPDGDLPRMAVQCEGL